MQSRLIETDTIRQHVWEAGKGPLVVLCHGFPELGYSWRHQVEALAEAGYRAVAPDMRGYGRTDKPLAVEAYTVLHLVGDMVALVAALGEKDAIVVGHDWGAPVAWHCGLLRPDIFKAVFALSVPFQPRNPKGRPIDLMRAITAKLGLGELYIVDFQRPDAEDEFDRDVETALRTGFFGYDGATPADQRSTGFLKDGESFLQSVKGPVTNPPWMRHEDLQVYVEAFDQGGFAGPINWYRNLDRTWELTAWMQGRKVDVPSFFMVGENDPVRNYTGLAEASLKTAVRDLRGKTVVKGAGHWLQQERPDEVNAALLGFIAEALGKPAQR